MNPVELDLHARHGVHYKPAVHLTATIQVLEYTTDWVREIPSNTPLDLATILGSETILSTMSYLVLHSAMLCYDAGHISCYRLG